MKQILEEKLISNIQDEGHGKEFLLMNTMQLYKTLAKVYQTTHCESLFSSYNMKEQYRKDYKLSLSEMYYNLGCYGLEVERLKENGKI